VVLRVYSVVLRVTKSITRRFCVKYQIKFDFSYLWFLGGFKPACLGRSIADRSNFFMQDARICNFTEPTNEATVILYTDVSFKKVWASSPNFFTHELRAGSSLPDV
jgi:hypothetical protein